MSTTPTTTLPLPTTFDVRQVAAIAVHIHDRQQMRAVAALDEYVAAVPGFRYVD